MARCHRKIPVHVSDLTWPVTLASCPECVCDATQSGHNVPQVVGHRALYSMLQSGCLFKGAQKTSELDFSP